MAGRTGFPALPAAPCPDARAHPGRRPSFARRPTPEPGVSRCCCRPWLIRRPEAQSPLWARRSLILLISLLTLRYLHWRCTDSLNLDSGLSTVLSLLMLLAEGWLLVTGLLPLWLAWRPFPDRRTQAADLARQWTAGRWQPKVAILVPSYGEPLHVLERTLRGCRAQTYPHCSVWLLDDSGREEARRLAGLDVITATVRSAPMPKRETSTTDCSAREN